MVESWFRQRQHDQIGRGYLTFFNNNMKDKNDEIFSKFLEINKINIEDMKSKKIFDGKNLKLYTNMEGTMSTVIE